MAIEFKKWVHLNAQNSHAVISVHDPAFDNLERYLMLQTRDNSWRTAVGAVANVGEYWKLRTLGAESDVAQMWQDEMLVKSGTSGKAHYNVLTDPITGRTFALKVTWKRPTSQTDNFGTITLDEFNFGITGTGEYAQVGSVKIRSTTSLMNGAQLKSATAGGIYGVPFGFLGGDGSWRTRTVYDFLRDTAYLQSSLTSVNDREMYFAITDSFIVNDKIYLIYGSVLAIAINLYLNPDGTANISTVNTADFDELRGFNSAKVSGWRRPKVIVDRGYIYAIYQNMVPMRMVVVPLVNNWGEKAIGFPGFIQNTLEHGTARNFGGSNRWFNMEPPSPYLSSQVPTAFFWNYNDNGFFDKFGVLYPTPNMDKRSNWLSSRSSANYHIVWYTLSGGVPTQVTNFQTLTDDDTGPVFQSEEFWMCADWADAGQVNHPYYFRNNSPVRHCMRIGLDKKRKVLVDPGNFFAKLIDRNIDASTVIEEERNAQDEVQTRRYSENERFVRMLIQPETATELWDDPFISQFEFTTGGYFYRVRKARQVRAKMWEVLCDVTGRSSD